MCVHLCWFIYIQKLIISFRIFKKIIIILAFQIIHFLFCCYCIHIYSFIFIHLHSQTSLLVFVPSLLLFYLSTSWIFVHVLIVLVFIHLYSFIYIHKVYYISFRIFSKLIISLLIKIMHFRSWFFFICSFIFITLHCSVMGKFCSVVIPLQINAFQLISESLWKKKKCWLIFLFP